MSYADEPSRFDSTPTWNLFKGAVNTATPTVAAGTIFWTGTQLRINVGTQDAPIYKTITTS